MVLVDTSVWIRLLAGQAPYRQRLDALLNFDEVAAHDFVFGELLTGAHHRGRSEFLSLYERIHRASTVPHRDVVRFVRDRKLYGRGISWIDAHLLASALVERLDLWTADSHLSALATELEVAYTSSGL